MVLNIYWLKDHTFILQTVRITNINLGTKHTGKQFGLAAYKPDSGVLFELKSTPRLLTVDNKGHLYFKNPDLKSKAYLIETTLAKKNE